MPFSIPDKGEASNDAQSILFQEYIDVLVAGLNGVDCVITGGAVTAQGAPDMTCAVAKAAIMSNGVLLPVTAGNVTITTADATNPRIDLVVATSAGAKAVRAGTPGANPKPPARTANDVVLAAVYVPATDTTIAANQIVDLRIMRGGLATGGGAPLTLKKQTTRVVTTTTTVTTIFTLTLPSGLLLAGQVLHVRCGGSYLMNNSTTPTLRLEVLYNAVALYDEITTGAAASAIRRPWHLDLSLIAQSNTVQALNGFLALGPPGVPPATTIGFGPLDAAQAVAARGMPVPIAGIAGSVDSDAGDRVFLIRHTLANVSAALVDFTTEYAIAELE